MTNHIIIHTESNGMVHAGTFDNATWERPWGKFEAEDTDMPLWYDFNKSPNLTVRLGDLELRKAGTPIEQEELRNGDRVRIEWNDGDTWEVTVGENHSLKDMPTHTGSVYLLNRPTPSWPTTPGSVITIRSRSTGGVRKVTLGKDGVWRGFDIAHAQDELAAKHDLVEVLL